MLFQVIDINGSVSCYTESQNCIYDIDLLKSMHSAGYKFKLDNKIISVDNICKLFKLSSKAKVPEKSEVKVKRKVRKVKCIQNNKVYKNMSEAGRDLGIDPAAISYSVQVNRPTTSGYSFEVIEGDN